MRNKSPDLQKNDISFENQDSTTGLSFEDFLFDKWLFNNVLSLQKTKVAFRAAVYIKMLNDLCFRKKHFYCQNISKSTLYVIPFLVLEGILS